MIRLLLVDDHASVRQGLKMRLALEPDFTVVAEAGDGLSALLLAQQYSPDVIIMDIEIPGTDGITATQVLRSTLPSSKVVMLSLHEDAVTKARARNAGAVAFVSKTEATEALVAAIRNAHSG